jgi:thiopurine S-methyltransferase
MNPEFWLEAWAAGRTNFHRDAVNDFLVRFAGDFLGERNRVLVPLCGMTHDLSWLRERGHDVVGVELAEQAVRALHDREQVTATIARQGPFIAYTTPGRTVLQGDVFDLDPAVVGTFDRVWDRAALIALDPERRVRYVAALRRVLAPGAVVLLVTMDYDASKKAGPPHAVPEAEVRALWAGARVEALAEDDILPEARGRGWNLDRLVEAAWRIELPA